MPNKKKSANRKQKEIQGFGVYLHERVNEYWRRGIPTSVAEMVSSCRAEWKRMAPEDQARYNNRAKAIKKKLVADDSLKSDSFGRNVAEVKAEERRKVEDVKSKQRKTEELIGKAFHANELTQKSFVLVHFQLFCTTTDDPARPYPCEVGAVKFSLEKGIENHYHSYIHPGALPVGYHLDMVKTSENSHQLKPEMVKDSTSYEGMKLNLYRLIKNPDDTYDPVFVLPDQVAVATQCLEFIFRQSLPFHRERNHFDVIDINELMLQLVAKGPLVIGSSEPWQYGKALIQEKLMSSKYDYARGTSCGYHELLDSQLHCALGSVMHRAIIICNMLSPLLGIKLLPGRHLHPIIPLAEVRKAQDAWDHKMAQLKGKVPPQTQGAVKDSKLNRAAYSTLPESVTSEAASMGDFDTDSLSGIGADSFGGKITNYWYFGAEDGDDAYEELSNEEDDIDPITVQPISPKKAQTGTRVQDEDGWRVAEGGSDKKDDAADGWVTVGGQKDARKKKPATGWVKGFRDALPR